MGWNWIQNGKIIAEDKSGDVAPLSTAWPPVLKYLKRFATEDDRGAGDIIARVIGPIGGDAFKKWYKLAFGRDCGCGNRQETLNRRWPLPK